MVGRIVEPFVRIVDMPNQKSARLFVVSNRLPVAVISEGGRWTLGPVAGGLVTAMAPIMERNHGVWIGWPGCGPEVPFGPLFERFNQEHRYQLVPIPLSKHEEEGYYRGFANEAIWPLFHDLLGHCRFEADTWAAYVDVNKRFAEVIASDLDRQSLVWVHDYQLLLVGADLRAAGVRRPISFFLHIPFPSLDLFRRMPWKHLIIRALLAYDQIGFQTIRDRQNFLQCVRGLVPETSVSMGRRGGELEFEGRTIKVGSFPISIDFDEFDEGARRMEVAEASWYLRERYRVGKLILGIDRLDYTKGIPETFLSFERALEKYPQMQGSVSLIQIVVPSRTHVPDYRDLKSLLDQLSGRINSRFSRHGWVPIHYLYRALDRTELLAHYRASDIALVTPLRDGMNLVAKEYCVSSVEERGVLILSEFAGAAEQLGRGALCVNPYDREGCADAIHQAYSMNEREQQSRMKLLRSQIRRNDVHRWLQTVLAMPQGGRLEGLPEATAEPADTRA